VSSLLSNITFLQLQNLFGFAEMQAPRSVTQSRGLESDDIYRVPEARAAGRPHDLGWLDLLDGDKESEMRFGEVPAGTIIFEE
jgi:hypothetical protein